MSTTYSNPSVGETREQVEAQDLSVEFSAKGKTPAEARVELFASLTRLEPTTATGRLLEDASGPLPGLLPRIPVVTTQSLPFAPMEPAVTARPRRRLPAFGMVAAGMVSAGFAVTLLAGTASLESGSGSVRAEGADSSLSFAPLVSVADLDAISGSPDVANGSGAINSSATMQPVRAMFAGGRIMLMGTVSTQGEADALVARASDLLGPGAVVNQLNVDAAAPTVAAVPVHVAERVRFAPGSSAIEGEHAALVATWRDVLAAFPSAQMKVTGFTDDRGSVEANDKLAMQRAQGVADWMHDQGIAGHRVVVAGGGATSPVATNDTPEGRAENRRIQVELDGLLVI